MDIVIEGGTLCLTIALPRICRFFPESNPASMKKLSAEEIALRLPISNSGKQFFVVKFRVGCSSLKENFLSYWGLAGHRCAKPCACCNTKGWLRLNPTIASAWQ